jgi:YHS domain-containing protein
MLKFIILFVVAFLIYRSLRSWIFSDTSKKKTVSGKASRQIDDVMIKDPYCKAYFPKRTAVHLNVSGNDLYFCSKECRDKYVAHQGQGN